MLFVFLIDDVTISDGVIPKIYFYWQTIGRLRHTSRWRVAFNWQIDSIIQMTVELVYSMNNFTQHTRGVVYVALSITLEIMKEFKIGFQLINNGFEIKIDNYGQ